MRQKVPVVVGLLVACVLAVQLFTESRKWYVGRTPQNPTEFQPPSLVPVSTGSLTERKDTADSAKLRKNQVREDSYNSHQSSPVTEKAEGGGSGDSPAPKHHYPTIPRYSSYPGELITDNYTIVIQTYKRNNILKEVLKHYCTAPRVDQILVVWNNVGRRVPSFLRKQPCERKLIFLPQERNTIRNRFKPFPEIRTDGELTRVAVILVVCVHEELECTVYIDHLYPQCTVSVHRVHRPLYPQCNSQCRAHAVA